MLMINDVNFKLYEYNFVYPKDSYCNEASMAYAKTKKRFVRNGTKNELFSGTLCC